MVKSMKGEKRDFKFGIISVLGIIGICGLSLYLWVRIQTGS